MEIDTTDTVGVRASAGRMILISLGALALAALSLVIASAGADTGGFGEFIGWMGVLFFGFAFVIAVWHANETAGQPVITLSPEGFLDLRISPKLIPWTAVEKISSWQDRNTRIIVVKVQEDIWQDLPINHVARLSRSDNASLGADGLTISTVELQVKFDRLLEAMTAYARAYGGKAG